MFAEEKILWWRRDVRWGIQEMGEGGNRRGGDGNEIGGISMENSIGFWRKREGGGEAFGRKALLAFFVIF